ncbi:hypothetical protein EI42_03881 [Thermosporothrix hazakensis]|uniref:Uncharacterized protein n=1 Tax=Thermosporothrix hazakensis TaxID=644383 RepID=A0A326U3V3_THEHA|nr:hypothetical protein EI42_03881 [Thermosporothrix hazakensis]
MMYKPVLAEKKRSSPLSLSTLTYACQSLEETEGLPFPAEQKSK